MDTKQSDGRFGVVLRWVARVWSLPAIFFAGAHLFEPDSASAGVQESWLTWAALGALFASVFSLVLAWRWAKFGGWLALVALTLSMGLYWVENGEFFPWGGFLLLLGGIAVPAVLFLWSERKA